MQSIAIYLKRDLGQAAVSDIIVMKVVANQRLLNGSKLQQ